MGHACDRAQILGALSGRLPDVVMKKFIPLEGASAVVWAFVRVDPASGRTKLFTEPTHQFRYRIAEPVFVTDYTFSNIDAAFTESIAESVADKAASVFAMFASVHWWSIEDASKRDARRGGLFELRYEFLLSVCGDKHPVPVYYCLPPPLLVPPLPPPSGQQLTYI